MTQLLKGLERDGRGEDDGVGSIALREHSPEAMTVKLQRKWHSVKSIAERRREGAAILLELLVSEIEPGVRGNDCLAATTLGRLTQAIQDDEALGSGRPMPEGSWSGRCSGCTNRRSSGSTRA